MMDRAQSTRAGIRSSARSKTPPGVALLGFSSEEGVRRDNGRLGTAPTIVNLDAHFDLRAAECPSSGTPFRQIAELAGPEFSYTVLGIPRPNNTRALFHVAAGHGVRVITHEELLSLSPAEAADQAPQAVEGHEHIHLSIDLDVLPADIAPGVSAPAAFGVDMATCPRHHPRAGRHRPAAAHRCR